MVGITRLFGVQRLTELHTTYVAGIGEYPRRNNIWHCLLKVRNLGSQLRNGMAEFSSVTKEKQIFL